MVIRGEGVIQPQRLESEIIFPRDPDLLIITRKDSLSLHEKQM